MFRKQQTQQMCDIKINYSEIVGERVLPFVISLDLADSVMIPAPGENQRFCYTVTGVGSDMPADANLDHLVLGIRGDIPESRFANISVKIDGAPRQVVFGENGNVSLMTSKNPDPETGCAGLKFNFPLDRAGGVMRLCYELTAPYPVGDNAVLLFGGGTAISGLNICGPVCEDIPICQTVGYQPAKLRVPVTVTPRIHAGTPTTICCGSPVVTPSACPGKDNSCSFVITQKICVAVPVEIGALTSIGELSMEYEDAAGEDALTGCLYNITLR